MAEPFNAKAARSKRPCPLWVDAFLRDTQHLAADEVGAYMLILMVMWSRESCDYPDDDHRLARVCRVSLRLWKSRLGPALRPFFQSASGALVSKRLREEAAYVERQCKAQSDRKRTEDDDKPLKYQDEALSADNQRKYPPDISPEYPSQQPNNPTVEEDDDESARVRDPSFFERALIAAGLNPNDLRSARWMPPAAEIEVNRWLDIAPGLLTEDLVIQHITESRRLHSGDPPEGPKAFERGLRQLAGTLSASTPTPIAANGIHTRAKGQTYGQRSDDAFAELEARLAVQPFRS